VGDIMFMPVLLPVASNMLHSTPPLWEDQGR